MSAPDERRARLTRTGDAEMKIEREFDAPPERVFSAMTDIERIPDWWGPAKYVTEVETYEPRVGGRWRFIHRAGEEVHGFHGEILEFDPPNGLTQTFIYEGAPQAVMTEKMTLEALEGDRTLLTVISTSDDPRAVQGMIDSGMEEGMNETYRRLDALLTAEDA